MSKQTRSILLALCVGTLLMLTACGSGSDGNNSPAAHHPEMPRSVMKAIVDDDVDAVREYLDDGGDPNAVYDDMRASCVQAAALIENSRSLPLLLEHGGDPDEKNANGVAPLSNAIISDRPENVLCLIEHGASQRDVDFMHNSALSVAVGELRVECARVLLEHGANPTENAGDWGTPLHAVAGNLFDDPLPMLKLLLAHMPDGASVDVENSNGDTPLGSAIATRNAECAILLLEHGADPSRCLAATNMILWYSARCDSAALMRRMLKSDLDVNAEGSRQETALHAAAADISNPELVRVLIDAGAEVNVKDKHGDTPLHFAARCSEDGEAKQRAIECVKLLLKHGADAAIKNEAGHTPRDDAYWLDVQMLLGDAGQ